jgi:hypothetical protein
MNKKILCQLFEFTEKTLYNWKKENRPIIKLIEKYFNDYELEWFLEHKEIVRLDILNKFIPITDRFEALEIVTNFKPIEQDEAIQGSITIFADLINYLHNYENKYNEHIENLIYYYISDNTFAKKIDKADFIRENNIDLNLIIYFSIDLKYDLIEFISTITNQCNKRDIFDYIVGFIAPLIDMKYNNSLNYYYDDFGEFISKKYKIEYIEFYDIENKFTKKMITDNINDYINKIKEKNNVPIAEPTKK